VYLEELEKVIDAVLNDKDTDPDNLPEVPTDDLMRPIIVLSTDALNKTTRNKAKAIISEYEASDDEDEEGLENASDDEAMDEDSDDMEDDSE
jgi:hypothetical protein